MSNEEFVIKNTKGIQIKSLCAFMEVFGYQLMLNGSFVTEGLHGWNNPVFKGCNVLSFNTAVKLHNGYYVDWHEDNFIPPFDVDKYTLNKAQAAKIVKQVFLQGTKYGVIKCHKQMVKFVDQSYQYRFLKDSE